MDPLEFVALQRRLVRHMTMRKKRNVQLGPVQVVKLALLDVLEQMAPEEAAFEAGLAEAVQTLGQEAGATGPAQAVASDLQLDWRMAQSSETYQQWLRDAAAASGVEGSPQPDSNR